MRHKSPAFERARNRATSAHLKALRNISLSVTVSTRALKVASFISLSGLDHHEGMRPQRIGTSDTMGITETYVFGGRPQVPIGALVMADD